VTSQQITGPYSSRGPVSELISMCHRKCVLIPMGFLLWQRTVPKRILLSMRIDTFQHKPLVTTDSLSLNFASSYGQELRETKTNSVASVHERTMQTERPPIVGEVSANFCGQRVLHGHRDGSPRAYSRISKLEPLLFIPSSSLIVLTKSGPRSRPNISQKIW
jgi:hypothetical protein